MPVAVLLSSPYFGIVALFLAALALLSIIRSHIVHYLFVDEIESYLERKGWWLLLDGLHCDECIAFWLIVSFCIIVNAEALILPVYGLMILYLRVVERWNNERTDD